MTQFFDSSFFSRNRKNLVSQILPNSIAVFFSAEEFPRNGDQYYKYRQNSDLFYLSGLTQEKSILVIYKDSSSKKTEEYVFIIEPDQKMITWTGHKYSKDEVHKISGITNVEFLGKFEEILTGLLLKTSSIYYSFSSNIRGIGYENTQIKNWKALFEKKRSNLLFNDIDPICMHLRLQKSKEEILVMQKAIDITGNSFKKALNFITPGVWEYEIEAELTRDFINAGANGHAYLPILASGLDNCILHYNTNRKKCLDGDLLLMDFGAEVNYYCADLSRTVPISGKFSTRQKQVYSSVLSVFKEIKTKIKPGNTIRQLNNECGELIQEELLKLGLLNRSQIELQDSEMPAYKKYFMHGVSHFIGLDVHDAGKKDTILQPGMILSCEPAIYIPEEGFGIRLENDILVDDSPIDLCENIPIEIEEIEYLMSRRKNRNT